MFLSEMLHAAMLQLVWVFWLGIVLTYDVLEPAAYMLGHEARLALFAWLDRWADRCEDWALRIQPEE